MNDVKVLTDLKGEPAFVQWVHAFREAFGICIKREVDHGYWNTPASPS
jgi:hypothetical protein